jgi:UDP-3-O-[3-hydroxymyristoyl] glucosamine N-acyltransferase
MSQTDTLPIKSITLKSLSKTLSCDYVGDPLKEIKGVNSLKNSSFDDICFFHNEKYTSLLLTTQAGVICVKKDTPLQQGKNYLLCDDPSLIFEKITHLFLENHSRSGFTHIHPTATIHPTAKIGKNPEIGPYVVIDREVIIGDNVILYPHVTIGPKCVIKDDCLFHAGVVVREDCLIGNRVILQPNCVIGGCGFGYNSCKKTGTHSKITHLGNVILEDDVEIGACTTIDRGRFSSTLIKQGTKIDNHCMIAHNCEIGENNLIVSMSGISGSTKTGKNVVIAAQCGIVGHIEIGDNVTLGARSAPIKSLKKPGVYLGAPAQPIKDEAIQMVCLKRLPSVLKKLKGAEKFLEQFQHTEPENL